MRNKLKPVLSLASIGVFLLISLATVPNFGDFFDEPTNTMVPISNCEARPPHSGTFHVDVTYKDKNGVPIVGAPGIIFITHQQADADCKPMSTTYSRDIVTDTSGTFALNEIDFTHDNSQDLFRVEVKINKTAFFNGYHKVKVGYYNNTWFSFYATGLRLQ